MLNEAKVETLIIYGIHPAVKRCKSLQIKELGILRKYAEIRIILPKIKKNILTRNRIIWYKEVQVCRA